MLYLSMIFLVSNLLKLKRFEVKTLPRKKSFTGRKLFRQATCCSILACKTALQKNIDTKLQELSLIKCN